jgi:hypothetical protein
VHRPDHLKREDQSEVMGVNHIVEVAFAANIARDIEILKQGGSISTNATNAPMPSIPFWEMVFKNVRLFFLGSDDFAIEAKIAAAKDLNGALEAGWEVVPRQKLHPEQSCCVFYDIESHAAPS